VADDADWSSDATTLSFTRASSYEYSEQTAQSPPSLIPASLTCQACNSRLAESVAVAQGSDLAELLGQACSSHPDFAALARGLHAGASGWERSSRPALGFEPALVRRSTAREWTPAITLQSCAS